MLSWSLSESKWEDTDWKSEALSRRLSSSDDAESSETSEISLIARENISREY